MEAREPADSSIRHAGSAGSRRLRSNYGARPADYAIIMMLAKLSLRANEVTLDDLDWRSGEMLVHAKGRQ